LREGSPVFSKRGPHEAVRNPQSSEKKARKSASPSPPKTTGAWNKPPERGIRVSSIEKTRRRSTRRLVKASIESEEPSLLIRETQKKNYRGKKEKVLRIKRFSGQEISSWS